MQPFPKRVRENYALERYQDDAGEHRWRLTSNANGKIVGASSEGFANGIDCLVNAYLVTGWTHVDVDYGMRVP